MITFDCCFSSGFSCPMFHHTQQLCCSCCECTQSHVCIPCLFGGFLFLLFLFFSMLHKRLFAVEPVLCNAFSLCCPPLCASIRMLLLLFRQKVENSCNKILPWKLKCRSTPSNFVLSEAHPGGICISPRRR